MSRLIAGPALALCLLGMSACAERPPSSPFAGTWTMTLGKHPFMVLTIHDGSGTYDGELVRPDHFSTSDFVRFTGMGPDVVSERISHAEVREGRLHFTTVNPRDASDTTEYEMWRDSEQGARITMADVPVTFEPLAFTRSSGTPPVVFTGWEAGCQYRTGDLKGPSAEMQKIYDADQEPRQNPTRLSAAEWVVIEGKDAERRARTRELLRAGALMTGEDFRKAAFVFQHGNTPDDYLMAHSLASIAVARGDASATWIMTATLDRYLQSIGKPQIYGTQFKATADATQEPFDRALISDAMRRELAVPSLAAQVEQQRDFAKQFHSAK
jgi:hypothetical protein